MKPQTKPQTSRTGKSVAQFHSRRLTPTEIESLRQDLRDAHTKLDELLRQKKEQQQKKKST